MQNDKIGTHDAKSRKKKYNNKNQIIPKEKNGKQK